MAEVIVSPNYGVRIRNAKLNSEYLLNLLEEKIPASEVFALDLESEEGNAIIFLSRAEFVYELIKDGIKSGVETLDTFPITAQYTISNVYPFFTNSYLYELFSNFGTVLKIECLTVHSDNTKLNHVMSGRRLITFLLPIYDAEIILPKCVEAKIGVFLEVEKHCCACLHDGHSMLECAELNNWYTAKKNFLHSREIQLDNVSVDEYCSDPDISIVDYSSDTSVDHYTVTHQVPSIASEAQNIRENYSSNIEKQLSSALTVFQEAHCYRHLDVLLGDSYSVTKHASKILRKYRQIRVLKKTKRVSIVSCKSNQFQDKSSEVGSKVKDFKGSSEKGEDGSNCNKVENSFSIKMTITSNEREKNMTNFTQVEKLDSLNIPQENYDLENVPISTNNNKNEGFSNCEKSINYCDPTRKNVFFDEDDSDSSCSSSSSLPSLKSILKTIRNSDQNC